MSALLNSGTIILNDSTKEIYQNLYASQNYNSFYSLFGKFVLKENTHQLRSLDLNLITYKGMLDMEIVAVELDYVDLPVGFLQDNPIRKIIDIKVSLKAATTLRAATTMSVDISKLEGIQLPPQQLIQTRRELLSFYKKTMTEIKAQDPTDRKMTDGGIFDTEFFYRNGKLSALRQDGDFALKPSDASSFTSATGLLFDDTASCKQRFTTMHF
ncbi:MAG: hypothetical protein ACI828_002453 [Flavobacteriales bacterium]|jgi:hypothetical protein